MHSETTKFIQCSFLLLSALSTAVVGGLEQLYKLLMMGGKTARNM
jgi:hypothetical protein